MTREDVRDNILGAKSNCILAELPTSLGKTKISLDFMHDRKLIGKKLIVIPRLILIENWKKEFAKWGYESYLEQVTFTTYRSLPKYISERFDLVIFDECHHLSERAREAVEDLVSNYYILLSATIKRTMLRDLKILFPNLERHTLTIKEAIKTEILPDPKVFLMKLKLNDKDITETIVLHPKAKKDGGEIPFSERFKAKMDKKTKYTIKCTQKQYNEEVSAMIEFYKKKYFATNNEFIFYRWQREAKHRLFWLSSLKDSIVLKLMEQLIDKKTLTFCNGVEQTKRLGEHCINHENKLSQELIQEFNAGKITHITACDMLNEGINLVACQVGIFVNLNSSETLQVQKIGRILRHPEPMIYFLYFEGTREEEIIKVMLENYNRELITIV